MGLNNYPYTNFHELNADWIIAKIKELISSYAELNSNFDTLTDNFNNLEQYVQNYFDDLDLTEEVRTVINEMIASGYIDQIVSEMVEEGYFRGIVNSIVHDTSSRPTQHNVNAVNQFLNVANTYYNNRTSLYYNNSGALNVTMNVDSGRYGIDCSTFLLLCLKGVPYSQSRYTNQGSRDDNYSMYDWGVDIYSGREKTVSGVKEYYRYSADIARWFWDNRLIYQPSSSFDNAKIGDIMFWVSPADVDTEDLESTLFGVHHCAIFTGLDASGNVTYIDANSIHADTIDNNVKAPSEVPNTVRYLGALPFLYNPNNDIQIRAKAYLSANTSVSNVGYEALALNSIGGATGYQAHISLSSNRLTVNESGLYMISAQMKVSQTTEFIQWRTVIIDSGNNSQNISEGSIGAFKDIAGNNHNGYSNVSYIRYLNAGDKVGINIAGTGTIMSNLLGTYIEVTKI